MIVILVAIFLTKRFNIPQRTPLFWHVKEVSNLFLVNFTETLCVYLKENRENIKNP